MNNKTIVEFGFRRMIYMKYYADLGGCYPPQLVLHNFQYQVQPDSIIVNHNIPFPPDGGMELLVCPNVCVLCNVIFFFPLVQRDEEHSWHHLVFDQEPLNCYN